MIIYHLCIAIKKLYYAQNEIVLYFMDIPCSLFKYICLYFYKIHITRLVLKKPLLVFLIYPASGFASE